jgi:Na+-driven multidrug efflux pump
VSTLGTDAVAAASLVVPVALLVTMVSNGGIGGGVSSAVARARGSGNQALAESVLWHAIILGLVLGAATTLLAWTLGPPLYWALGGRATQELPVWLHQYNWHRPHGGIDCQTPTSPLGLTKDNLLRLHT